MKLSRILARWKANALGYFWTPCPLCGEEFGGHEWRRVYGHESSIPTSDGAGNGKGICPNCTAAGHGCVQQVLHADLVWISHPCYHTRIVLAHRYGDETAEQVISKLSRR